MNNQNLAIKIKDLRNRKGFSQERLAEDSKLSLRTIQRIEKGESIPRGDTLIKLTQALEVTPDDLLDWTKIEDRGFLAILILSTVSTFIHPLLGLFIPTILWVLKKDKVNLVDHTGKCIINFQLVWIFLLYIIMFIVANGRPLLFDFNLSTLFFTVFRQFSTLISISLLGLYISSLLFTLINLFRNYKGLKSKTLVKLI